MLNMKEEVVLELKLTRQQFLDWFIILSRVKGMKTNELRQLENMRDLFTEDYTAPNRKNGKWFTGCEQTTNKKKVYKLTKFKKTPPAKKKGR